MKILVMGPSGSGKTYLTERLVPLGEKFFHVFSYIKKEFFLQKPTCLTHSTVTDSVLTEN